jgi:hypothetical protein
LYSLSKDKAEYTKNKRMLNGDLKSKLDGPAINRALLDNAEGLLEGKSVVCVVHDTSPIRKPESRTIECLGKVTDLDNGVVNGYEAFCSVLLDMDGKEIRLAGCEVFSNGDPCFVSVKERGLYEKGRLDDEGRRAEIAELDNLGKSFNTFDLVSGQVRRISERLSTTSPGVSVVSIYDRGFDDEKLFRLEVSLGNNFITRLKGNRNSSEVYVGRDGKEVSVKLKKRFFMEGEELVYEHLRFKDRSYFGVKATFSWEDVELGGHVYHALRVELRDKGGKRLFGEDMLLLTSLEINSIELARVVWQMYMLRTKIESVFRFCKQELGWETPRMDDWEAMKNLLTFVFFVAGFFYETKHSLTKDPQCVWIAKLANSKGEVTVHFLLKGLAIMAGYLEVKRKLDSGEITEEDIVNAAKKYNLT